MEDTRLDLLQYDTESTGRSVPTTPLQTSPPGKIYVVCRKSIIILLKLEGGHSLTLAACELGKIIISFLEC